MNRDRSEQPLFAVIGCGLIGRKRVAALGRTPPLLYTCDLDAARAADLAKTASGCTPVTDYTTVLADPRVDAVIVSTLNASLAPITLAAVRAGKHVLVEKPGALDAAQLREVADVAKKTGARVRIGYNHR
jgi:predicted dehydrogenase